MCGNQQAGIVSGGLGCGIKGLAGTYTRVAAFDDFIFRTLSKGPKLFPEHIFWTLFSNAYFIFVNNKVVQPLLWLLYLNDLKIYFRSSKRIL